MAQEHQKRIRLQSDPRNQTAAVLLSEGQYSDNEIFCGTVSFIGTDDEELDMRDVWTEAFNLADYAQRVIPKIDRG